MTWLKYFFKLINVIKLKSKDSNTKVGSLIIGKDNEIISTGFNGFCRGVKDDVNDRNIAPRYQRPLKYKWTEHAERNAIYNAARKVLKGTSLFVTWCPCSDCARGIIQSGIANIFIESNKVPARWFDDCCIALEMINEAGVKIFGSDGNFFKELVKVED